MIMFSVPLIYRLKKLEEAEERRRQEEEERVRKLKEQVTGRSLNLHLMTLTVIAIKSSIYVLLFYLPFSETVLKFLFHNQIIK